jgi:hypothetical protein
MSDKIFILDEIVVPEGQSAKLREAYFTRYAPSARARGMSLEGAWRSPAIALVERHCTLRFLWSVPDVAGWWAMRLGAARANSALDVPIDGGDEKLAWWAYVDSIATERKRTFMVDIEGGPEDATHV